MSNEKKFNGAQDGAPIKVPTGNKTAGQNIKTPAKSTGNGKKG